MYRKFYMHIHIYAYNYIHFIIMNKILLTILFIQSSCLEYLNNFIRYFIVYELWYQMFITILFIKSIHILILLIGTKHNSIFNTFYWYVMHILYVCTEFKKKIYKTDEQKSAFIKQEEHRYYLTVFSFVIMLNTSNYT